MILMPVYACLHLPPLKGGSEVLMLTKILGKSQIMVC